MSLILETPIRSVPLLIAATLSGPAWANTVVIDDTFDEIVPEVAVTPADDLDDPLDVAWTPISNSASQVRVGGPDDLIVFGTPLTSGDWLEASKNGAFGGIRANFASDPLLTLGSGDTLTATFDLVLFDNPLGPPTGGNGSGFRFGFFDSSGYGAFASVGIDGASSTGNTSVRIRQDPSPDTNDLMAGGSGLRDFEGPNDVTNAVDAENGLLIDEIYQVLLSAERTANDRTLYTVEINGVTTTSLDVDDLDDPGDALFDFSEGFFVIRTGNDQSDLRIDNFKIESTVVGVGVITGDYDVSGQVEQGDLDIVLQNWGTGTFTGDEAALVGGGPFDGTVDQNELDGVLQNWGSTSAPSFDGSAVPEPAAACALFGLGGLAMSRRRA